MKIGNGLFVENSDGMLGVVVNSEIIYQDGEFDFLSSYDENGVSISCKDLKIRKIFRADCFLDCHDDKVIWQGEKNILDDGEKGYLSAVIKPFKNRVKYIKKLKWGDLSHEADFIVIRCESAIKWKNSEGIVLPLFEIGTMYKGMKYNKEYTIKELGLE